MSNQVLYIPYRRQKSRLLNPEIQTELIRKAIHLLIAFVPVIAQSIGRSITMILLLIGVLAYTVAEFLHRRGTTIPIISSIIDMSSRKRDKGHFILAPITLGIGAALSLMLYPEPAASIAIYTLAFGDGLASLFGKLFGTVYIPFTKGKTIEGSAACFFAVFISSFIVLNSYVPDLWPPTALFAALWIAVIATGFEAIPIRDFDNIIVPVGTGLFVQVFYSSFPSI